MFSSSRFGRVRRRQRRALARLDRALSLEPALRALAGLFPEPARRAPVRAEPPWPVPDRAHRPWRLSFPYQEM